MLARCRIRLTEFSTGLADFEIVVFFRGRGWRPGHGIAAEFGRGQAGIGLEGAIERSDRLESGVQGYCEHRHVALASIRQRRLGFVEPVAVEKRIEVAIAETFVDGLPQPV